MGEYEADGDAAATIAKKKMSHDSTVKTEPSGPYRSTLSSRERGSQSPDTAEYRTTPVPVSRAPGSRGSHATRPASSRCCVHHHMRTAETSCSGNPRAVPAPNPSRTAPWDTSTVTQTRSHTPQRHTTVRSPERGRCQERSHSLCSARLNAVADRSATSTPTAPQVSSDSAAPVWTASTWVRTGPSVPSWSRSVTTSSRRTAGGVKDAMAKSSGSAARKACAASRVAMSRMLTLTSCRPTGPPMRPVNVRASLVNTMTVPSWPAETCRHVTLSPAGPPRLARGG